MCELFDKQSEYIKESLEKNFWGSRKLPQAHEKVCDENRSRIRKKRHARKNVFNGKEEFIRHLQKGHVMDINELQVNDS